jgi:ribonuclease P protein component
MLPKQNRLVKDKDIKQTLSSGVRFFYGGLQIRLSKSLLPKFRILVSVSKKIHKKSVHRHRVSRRLLAVIRQSYNTNSLPNNIDCFISISNKNILNSQIYLDYKELPILIYQKTQKLFNY